MGQDRLGSNKGRRPGVVKQAKKSNRGFFIALAAVAIAGIAGISYFATRSSASRRVVEVDPTLPKVAAVGYTLGSPDAPVEVVEFADFECPACGQFAVLTAPDVKKRLVETGQVRLRVLDFPLPIHQNAWTASLAAACANAQGKFWEMHDALYMAQDRWNTQATRDPLSVISRLAAGVGIDAGKLEQCVEARTYQANVQAHMDEANRRGVGSTPSFIIGGKLVPGAIGFDTFKAYVDSALARGGTAAASPAAPTTGTPAAAPLTPAPATRSP